MIKTLIIEDEIPAAARLEKLLIEIEPQITITGKLDSVESSVKWLNNNPHPDLIMLDIQLADGLSFEIFKKIKTDSFVIFTTAYDEFAIKAFELNSVDYLLKPVNKEFLAKSIEKFKALQGRANVNIDQLIKALENKTRNYKTRFIVNVGNKIKTVDTHEIAFFYSLEKSTFLCTAANKNYPVDFSLDALESLVDPEHFFRINRQYLVSFPAIKNISILTKSRIKLEVYPLTNKEIYVSSARTSDFRKWLEK